MEKSLGRFLPNPKLKLREQLREVCRFRHMSHRTEGGGQAARVAAFVPRQRGGSTAPMKAGRAVPSGLLVGMGAVAAAMTGGPERLRLTFRQFVSPW